MMTSRSVQQMHSVDHSTSIVLELQCSAKVVILLDVRATDILTLRSAQ